MDMFAHAYGFTESRRDPDAYTAYAVTYCEAISCGLSEPDARAVATRAYIAERQRTLEGAGG